MKTPIGRGCVVMLVAVLSVGIVASCGKSGAPGKRKKESRESKEQTGKGLAPAEDTKDVSRADQPEETAAAGLTWTDVQGKWRAAADVGQSVSLRFTSTKWGGDPKRRMYILVVDRADGSKYMRSGSYALGPGKTLTLSGIGTAEHKGAGRLKVHYASDKVSFDGTFNRAN